MSEDVWIVVTDGYVLPCWRIDNSTKKMPNSWAVVERLSYSAKCWKTLDGTAPLRLVNKVW